MTDDEDDQPSKCDAGTRRERDREEACGHHQAAWDDVPEGVARATEALLRKQTDAAGAQKILVDYVKQVLGDDAVK